MAVPVQIMKTSDIALGMSALTTKKPQKFVRVQRIIDNNNIEVREFTKMNTFLIESKYLKPAHIDRWCDACGDHYYSDRSVTCPECTS